MPPGQLVAHLLSAHHEYLHRELPELDRLAAKVFEVDGGRHPEPVRVRVLVREIAADLGHDTHLSVFEESYLPFPKVAQLEEVTS